MKLFSNVLLGCVLGLAVGCGSAAPPVESPPIDNEGPPQATPNRITRAEYEARLADGRLTRISPTRLDDGPLPMGWSDGMPPVVTSNGNVVTATACGWDDDNNGPTLLVDQNGSVYVTYAPTPTTRPGAELQKIMIAPPPCATRNYDLAPDQTYVDVLIVY